MPFFFSHGPMATVCTLSVSYVHASDCAVTTEHSKVSDECLKYFRGPSIVHVGELFGETAGENPFGMSTNYTFQLDVRRILTTQSNQEYMLM